MPVPIVTENQDGVKFCIARFHPPWRSRISHFGKGWVFEEAICRVAFVVQVFVGWSSPVRERVCDRIGPGAVISL